jgi:hypothetical protein
VLAVGLVLVILAPPRSPKWSATASQAYGAVVVSALIWPLVAGGTANESRAIYAAVSLLLLALAVAMLAPEILRSPSTVESETPARGWRWEATLAIIAASIAGVALAISVVRPVLTVTVLPYSWVAEIWTGRPNGTGLTPSGASLAGSGPAAVALAILALASVVAAYARTRRPLAALSGLDFGGPTAILVGLAAVQAPWPSLPAATLLIGLTLALVVGLTAVAGWRSVRVTAQAIVYIGAGLAGALVVEWATLGALGAVTVAATVIGVVGGSRNRRVVGWVASVTAALAAAAAAGLAADLPARDTAFAVLAVAVVGLFVGGAILTRLPNRNLEARAAQAAAHAGAVVAVIFTLGWTGRTALVCLLWGIAVGLRALLPGTSRAGRASLAAVAGGFELLAWWLLLTSRGVRLVEAYTVPLALVALLAGWAALRSRPDLRSWVAFGPALVAGFGPSLAVVLGAEGVPLRRLILGVAALGVVWLGAIAHRKAPVVIGGVVLALVALHELVLLWQRVQGWIPLAVGGALLLGLAITYERRLRDLRRLRSAIGRMT